MATEEDREENFPSSGAVFTFGRSRFADNEPNRFWIRDDPVKQVACGDEHTVLLTVSGRVFTFGANDYGQLGHGGNKTFNKPTSVKGLKGHEVGYVSCGRSHTLILLTTGEILSFGQNNEGQLGVGDERVRQIPSEVLKLDKVKIVAVAGGAEHSVALTAKGLLYVWGSNGDGQLGIDDINQTNVPHSVDFQEPIRQVACGYYHTAFVTEKGQLYTFGEADYGKLGFVSNRNVFAPKLVAGLRGKVKKVCCGGRHTVALTDTGLVYTFGDGSQGQLGLGPETLEAHQPEIVEKLSRMKARDIECGENHTAVVAENRQMYIWGDGQHGKLGVGNTGANAFVPQHLTKFIKFDVLQVSCGGCHTIVLAKPSNSWEDREVHRKKLTNKAVSFHGRAAKSDDDDDSDRNSDQERRRSDFSTTLPPRDKRRLKSLHDPSESFNFGRTLPPLGQKNGFLPTFNDRNGGRPDPFARPVKADSDDSDSDASPKAAPRSTSLYASAQTKNDKTDSFSRFATNKHKANSDSDSDASPRKTENQNLKAKSYSLYKTPTKNHTDSSEDDRSTKSEPSKYQASSSTFKNFPNGRKADLPPAYHKSGSFSAQLDYTKSSKVKNVKSNSESDTDDKRRPPSSNKKLQKFRKSSESHSSDDDRNKNRRNNSASTDGSRKDDKNSKFSRKIEEEKKSKFLDKFRGSKSVKKNGPGRDDSDTETTVSKENTKSKTCVIL